MGQDQFSAILPYIVDDLASSIIERLKISEEELIPLLYSSKLYTLLEDEETKLWQYSTEKLLSLFVEEQETGAITFPDV